MNWTVKSQGIYTLKEKNDTCEVVVHDLKSEISYLLHAENIDTNAVQDCFTCEWAFRPQHRKSMRDSLPKNGEHPH